MIGLDTNIIIRYLTQDNEIQSKLATKLIEETISIENPGFITLLTLVEISWVLETCYKQNKTDICNVLNEILVTKQLQVEKKESAFLALKQSKTLNADFSDALIFVISDKEGCEKTLTFDKKAQRVGMELLS